MKMLFLKKILKQSILITLIVSLAFTPVAALENNAEASQEAPETQQQSLPEQQTPEENTQASDEKGSQEGTEESIEENIEESAGESADESIAEPLTKEQEVSQQSEETEDLAEKANAPENIEKPDAAAKKSSGPAIQNIEELPEVSASGDNRDKKHEPVQEYEKMADSWRFRNGEVLRDKATSAPLLYASFQPWEWSSSKGGYLSSNGKVIEGAIKKGVDVSAWQPDIDWAKVKKAGIDFAILRCGYGDDIASQDDSTWLYNVQQCEKYGIPYGVYIYSYVESDSEARSEANHVLRLLEEAEADPDYPVYYDLEDNVVRKYGKKKIVKWAKMFCDAIEAKGYKAGIYANLNWWNNYLNDSSLDKYEKWVAQYYNKCQYEGEYRIWQCASDGKVPGIKGNVDINFEFQLEDTDYYMEGWITDDDGKTVFQEADGTIAKSQWIVYNGKKYYVNKSGQKVKGFQTIKGSKYYFNKDGVMQKSKWLIVSKKKYYAGSNGKIVTGRKKIGSYYYIFDSKGVMQKSKWLTVSKKKYYASSTGKLVTGYKKIGSYYYGFNASGVMLTGTKVLNGKKYTFMKNGKAYLFKVKTKVNLNYRKGAGVKYKRMGTYKKGKTVTIVRQKNGWGQMINGYWVHMKYVKKTMTYPQFAAYNVKTKTALNYRTGPSTEYKRKGTYKKGKVLTIRNARNGWGKLSNGYWVKLSYTKRI